jgi:hypothetical protein
VTRAFADLPEAAWVSPVMFLTPGLYVQYFGLLMREHSRRPLFIFGNSLAAWRFSFVAGITSTLSFLGMFIATIALIVKRFEWRTSTRNYEVFSSVLADPTLLGADLPPACLDAVAGLSPDFGRYITDPQGDNFNWVTVCQFAVCLWVLYKLGTFFQGAPRQLTANILQLSLALGVSQVHCFLPHGCWLSSMALFFSGRYAAIPVGLKPTMVASEENVKETLTDGTRVIEEIRGIRAGSHSYNDLFKIPIRKLANEELW